MMPIENEAQKASKGNTGENGSLLDRIDNAVNRTGEPSIRLGRHEENPQPTYTPVNPFGDDFPQELTGDQVSEQIASGPVEAPLPQLPSRRLAGQQNREEYLKMLRDGLTDGISEEDRKAALKEYFDAKEQAMAADWTDGTNDPDKDRQLSYNEWRKMNPSYFEADNRNKQLHVETQPMEFKKDVDLTEFVKAQGRFIAAQQRFITTGNTRAYLDAQLEFMRMQGDIIWQHSEELYSKIAGEMIIHQFALLHELGIA